MQIVEIKNNLVKISYDTSLDNLALSGLVLIQDPTQEENQPEQQAYIGQVIHLEANAKGVFAILKLLFNLESDGSITDYKGSIPDFKSTLESILLENLLKLFPTENPIIIGNFPQQEKRFKLDRSLLEQKLLVCVEKEEDTEILTKNFVTQLTLQNKKSLVFDISGDFSENFLKEPMLEHNKITAGKDFKLPLNYETINFIYEKGLDDAKAETKALIQEVFSEVQDYVKTLSEKFIPFETFKDVVNAQYEELRLIELVLLKNKLLKYYEAGVFAQEKDEFNSLKNSLLNENVTVFDLSNIEESVQREVLAYAYSLASELGEEIYVFFNITNSNSDKKLLKQIFSTKNAYSTLFCTYAYKYLKELNQHSKDLILFAPIHQQTNFANHSVFLNKLNVHEFVIYGQATNNFPMIAKLDKITKSDFEVVSDNEVAKQELQPKEEIPSEVIISEDTETFDFADLEQRLDNTETEDDFKVEVLNEPFDELEVLEEGLTENDLDLIDDLNIGRSEFINEFVASPIVMEEEKFEEIYANPSESDVEVEDEVVVEEEPTSPLSNTLSQEALEPEKVFEQDFGQESESLPEPPAVDILPAKMSSVPIVPIYSADVEPKAGDLETFEQGDSVVHAKYGKGTVEKLINYGSKTLCSINFDNVGRRLLDPTLAELKKI